MNNTDRDQLVTLLEEALAILRNQTDASAQSGGTGNGPPEGP